MYLETPDGSGETERMRLEHVVKHTNGAVVPEPLQNLVKCPCEFGRTLDVFFKISSVRDTKEFGTAVMSQPLNPVTIKSWLDMYQMQLSPIEHDALAAMDRAYLRATMK